MAVGNGRITFTRTLAGRPQILTVDAAGGSERQLTTAGANDYPAWSRDGSKLAFASDRTGNYDLFSCDLATGAVQQLTNDPADDAAPAVFKRTGATGDAWRIASKITAEVRPEKA